MTASGRKGFAAKPYNVDAEYAQTMPLSIELTPMLKERQSEKVIFRLGVK